MPDSADKLTILTLKIGKKNPLSNWPMAKNMLVAESTFSTPNNAPPPIDAQCIGVGLRIWCTTINTIAVRSDTVNKTHIK